MSLYENHDVKTGGGRSYRWRSRSPVRDGHRLEQQGRDYREPRAQYTRRQHQEDRTYWDSPTQYTHRQEFEDRDYRQPHNQHTHRRHNRSHEPAAVRLEQIRNTAIPETAYNLRAYTDHIASNHSFRRHDTLQNQHLPRFHNGDGKVNPSAYGSVLQYDLGLCYTTFRTGHFCEMGTKCAWRHHALSMREKRWMEEICGERTRFFIEDADKCWDRPDVPVPGRNMGDVIEQEEDYRRRGGEGEGEAAR